MKSKLIGIWVQLRDLWLWLFRHALIVNGYVDDHTWHGIRHRNWGDDLDYYFIREITGRPVVLYHNFRLAKWLHLKNYLCIGTLLDATNYANAETIVWGTGVSGQERDFHTPKKICAVRGRLTQDFLRRYHKPVPDVIGDPALLLPLWYRPRVEKKYQLGIIPHVVDQGHEVIRAIKAEHPEIKVIDLAHYDRWTNIIDEICECRAILSSSLHGLIVSDAYGVPDTWIELTGNVAAGYFKYRDYASSVDRNLDTPFKIETLEDIDKAVALCQKWQQPKINVQSLINVCPFPLKIKSQKA